MPLTVGVLKETLHSETRVALTPEITGKLQGLGVAIVMEHGAGQGSQLLDSEYEGVEFADSDGVLTKSDLLFTVQPASEDTVTAAKTIISGKDVTKARAPGSAVNNNAPTTMTGLRPILSLDLPNSAWPITMKTPVTATTTPNCMVDHSRVL